MTIQGIMMTIDRLNGLGSPFGFETMILPTNRLANQLAKWPGKPVRV